MPKKTKGPSTKRSRDIHSLLKELIKVGDQFYARNWILGPAGNFSAVVSRMPFEMVITKSGVAKGSLTISDFVHLNKFGQALDAVRPPTETPVHWAIISDRNAGAVLHTHSVWSAVLAEVHAEFQGVNLQGFEALKGLSQVMSHQHQEWVPILENSHNYSTLATTVAHVLRTHPTIHAMLLRKHGFYTWGATIEEAARHAEIFELLFEVLVRQLHIFSQFDLREASKTYN